MDELTRFAAAIRQGIGLDGIQCINYSCERGLEVYRNNYRGGLQEALANAYPVCKQLVGETYFSQLARQFIAGKAVYSSNVHDYGGEFADFLDLQPALPYLPDMARLEWAYHRAYFAADQACTFMAQLAHIDNWAGISCVLHPSCHLLSSTYPLSAIWQLHQQNDADWDAVQFDTGMMYFLLCRPQQQVQMIDLPFAQFCWLQWLQQGQTLEQASEQVLAQCSDFDLAGSLRYWVAKGVLSRLEHS